MNSIYLSKYAAMKTHFDNLIHNRFGVNTGLESIRTTFEKAFDISLNKHDAYETELKVRTNPTTGIITIFGPELKDGKQMPSGFIPLLGESKIFHVNHFTSVITLDMDREVLREYLRIVMDIMKDIVKTDFFYNANGPYAKLLRLYPIYFAFHHSKMIPQIVTRDDVHQAFFKEIKMLAGYEADKVFERLISTSYTVDPDEIYHNILLDVEEFGEE